MPSEMVWGKRDPVRGKVLRSDKGDGSKGRLALRQKCYVPGEDRDFGHTLTSAANLEV